jgi:predicted phosphodiesterase
MSILETQLDRRTVLKALLAGSATLLLERLQPVSFAQTGSAALLIGSEEVSLGSGMRLVTTRRVDALGWLRDYLLEVDLQNPAVTTDLLFGSSLASAETVSSYAARAGAAVAINGDFFDINNTKAPIGAVLRDGNLLKTGATEWRYAGVGADRAGRLFQLQARASYRVNDGAPLNVQNLNTSQINAGNVALYTPAWSGESEFVEVNAAKVLRLVRLENGVVTTISELSVTNNRVSLPAPPANGALLVGREAGAEALNALKVGDRVTLETRASVSPDAGARALVGGNFVLLENGVVNAQLDAQDIAARSAIGFSRDGRKLFLVVVDGKQASSRGMTLAEFARRVLEHGAFNALNIDGGGSSALVARQPGSSVATLRNSPSDGEERPVANAFGIFVARGSGALRSLEVQTVLLAGDRVFPGLTRRLKAVGSDENGSPVAADRVAWTLEGTGGSVTPDGLLRAPPSSGEVLARASQDGVTAARGLRVLGALERVYTDVPRLALVGRDVVNLRILGADADGYGAPLEAGDVTLEYDQALLRLEVTDDGFRVTPLKDGGATLVKIGVRGSSVTSTLPVTVGLREVVVTDFANANAWTSAVARAVATLTPVSARRGNGLRLSYDFTGTCAGCSTGTRAAYIRPNAPAPFLELPGQPLRVGVWVRSEDGRLPWLRAAMRHAGNPGADTVINLTTDYQENVGRDWVYAEGSVPAGIQYPLYLRQIYPVETQAARVYKGSLDFDSVVAQLAPDLNLPDAMPRADALVVGALEPSRWRYAVLNDAHLYASDANSTEARLTRAALRQIRAARPQVLIVAGDFIENGTPEDFAFAKTVFSEELGATPPFPVYYLPGNHELFPQTTGKIDNYLAAGYKLFQSFDLRGVRFILLNTANARLHTPDPMQLAQLERLLTDASSDRTIEHVAVIGHHPPTDPKPPFDREIGSLEDVNFLRTRLTRFTETSGKGVVYHAGHAHYADVQRFDGVPYVIAPAAGKAPYTAPADGGFNGWMLYGVQSGASKRDWLRAEIRPLLEKLRLEIPARVEVGRIVRVNAVGEQSRGTPIPLRYPASVTWRGTSLTVGNAERAQTAAALDPITNTLTGLRPGVTTVELEVNGLKALARVEIVRSNG